MARAPLSRATRTARKDEGPADALPANPDPGEETGDRPDRALLLVLVTACPWHLLVAEPALVVAPELDGAPTHGDAVEVGDESARLGAAGVAARGLDSESVCSLLDVVDPKDSSGASL